jgi:hypothetical protein
VYDSRCVFVVLVLSALDVVGFRVKASLPLNGIQTGTEECRAGFPGPCLSMLQEQALDV